MIYEPSCLIVGTRGRSLNGIQGLLPGSVSKYCLQNSPVPVIVVKPTSKREKKKRKRRADPSRRSYMEILEKSGARGSRVLDTVEHEKSAGAAEDEASQQEAEAVARAIGLPADYSVSRTSKKRDDSADGGSLSRISTGRSDYTSGPDSPSPTGPMSPDRSSFGAQSPEVERLDSPSESSDESGERGKGREGSPKPAEDSKPKEGDLNLALSTAELKIGKDIV